MADGSGGGLTSLLKSLSPEQTVLLAAAFAIALTEGLTQDDATTLALFLSTTASNIGLIYQVQDMGESDEDLPGIV